MVVHVCVTIETMLCGRCWGVVVERVNGEQLRLAPFIADLHISIIRKNINAVDNDKYQHPAS